MGKWILYGLILLNLFAFLWFSSNSADEVTPPKQQTKALLNSDKIAIVKADSDSQLQTTTTEQAPEEPVAKQQQDSSPKTIDDPLKAIIDQRNQNKPATATQQPSITEQSTEIVDANAAESNIEDKPTDKAPVVQQPKKKIAENSNILPETTQPARSQEEQKLLNEMASFASIDKVPSTPTAILTEYCYQYGPLNKTQAEAITTVMQQQQIPVKQQSRVQVEARGFLVLIMPQKNINAAKSEMRSARKAGLDAFAITKGEWTNGVSLGIFSTKENADKLFKKAKGLIPKSQVSIKKRVREQEIYRILFKLKNQQDPAILLANNPFPRFNSKNPLQKTTKVAKKSCETVEF